MNLTVKLILLLVCQLISICVVPGQDLRTELEKIIDRDTDISHENIPGFIIGIVDNDSIFYESFGSAVKGNSQQISPESLFEVGGLTKVFTALLCQLLHDRGTINLDHSINSYLPEKLQNPALDALTFKHLLTHTSGLPYLPGNLAGTETDPDNRYTSYTTDDLSNYLGNIKKPPLLGNYLYSHTNYAIIGWILSEHTGKSMQEMITKDLFAKVSMKNSYLADEKNDTGNISPGYDFAGKQTAPWTFPTFAASEGMRTSAQDLCLFIRQMLSQDDAVASSFSQTLQPVVKIPRSKRSYAGIGWHMMKGKKKEPIYLHSGKTTGHAASMHFITQTRTAVILITNSPGRMDGLAMSVLRMINDNWKRI